MSTGLYYPKYYVLQDESLRDKPRVKEIIDNCKGAQKLAKDEAVTKLSGLSAPKRYALGKQTLYIKEIKRSSVHFFSIPKGAIENPQLIINHGMICPHFCHYCYWQKDLYSSSMITVHANPKEDFVEDIKIASIIWRAFSPLISSDICKDKVSDTLFLRLDKKIRKKGISSDDKVLKNVCLDFVTGLMEDWKIPKEEQKSIIGRIKNPTYKPKVIFDSGENNDSVALEHITNIQNDILIPTILSMDNAYLILRTKSIYFGFLEKLYKHPKRNHIIISPSINPHYLIEKYEPGNHSLEDRLESLRAAAIMGFKIFLCFSPMIYERGSWRKLYADFVEEVRRYLPPEKVHYYTVGSLRLSKQALRNIRNIHPGTPLDSPYFIPPANTSGDKFRYSGDIRRTMYAFLIREMDKAGYDKVPRYLQTETIELWQSLMTDQYKDLNLDMDAYRSGEMELKALTEPSSHDKEGNYTGKKLAFTYEGKTGIAETKAFQKKELADFACNLGSICPFGCTFCYVPTVTLKQKYVQNILKQGYQWDEVSLYRTKDNLLRCIERDLKKIGRDDNRMVIFCTTCDPCPTEKDADITTSAIRLIMESSNLQVRVLSKSILILEIAKALDKFKDRIVYGLSTGTFRDEISACIEGNTSSIRERIEMVKVLQESGYRTYGMLCPILPSEMPYLDKLVDAIEPGKCEHIWAEAINLRGKSLVRTRDKLKSCGLDGDAHSLEQVMGNKENWRNYSKELFLNVRAELEKRGASDKLRYLQYVTGEPKEFTQFFESESGALCL